MDELRPLMRALSLALHEFTQEHAGKDPWQITMCEATRGALYREMFGDAEGEDMRAALGAEVAINDMLPDGEFRLA